MPEGMFLVAVSHDNKSVDDNVRTDDRSDDNAVSKIVRSDDDVVDNYDK